MQTFLPTSDFRESARLLDYKRLGKQRVEGMQLLNAMQPDYDKKGWLKHPAKIMWEGHEDMLRKYVNEIDNYPYYWPVGDRFRVSTPDRTGTRWESEL